MTGRAAVAAPMGSPVAVAVALPRPGRPAAVAALVLAVILLTAFLLVRYAVLRRGGWRRSWRRLRSEAALTGQAFTEPLCALSRYRQGLRALTSHLADPGTHALAHQALDAAASALASAPGAYPYAVGVGAGAVTVEVAGRRLPSPPAPWRVDAATPGRWRIDRGELRQPGNRGRRVLVGVGVRGEECVLLDLAASPGTVAVEGDSAAGRGLLQAVAAQLDGPAGVAGTVVARGVHPQYRGPDLESVIGSLERSGTGPDGSPAVVVCCAPHPEQAARLGVLAETDTALCLVHGEVTGARWTLRVDHRNRLTAAELDLRADCAPLGRAVARALRSARRGHAVPPERAPVMPPDDTSWTPGEVPAEPVHGYGLPYPVVHGTHAPGPPRADALAEPGPYPQGHATHTTNPDHHPPPPPTNTHPAPTTTPWPDTHPAPYDTPNGPGPYGQNPGNHAPNPAGHATPPRANAQAGPAPYGIPNTPGPYAPFAGDHDAPAEYSPPTEPPARPRADTPAGPPPYAQGHAPHTTGPDGYPTPPPADARTQDTRHHGDYGTGPDGYPGPSQAGVPYVRAGHGAPGYAAPPQPAPPRADTAGAPWAPAQPGDGRPDPYGDGTPAEDAPSERARRAARTRHYVRRDRED